MKRVMCSNMLILLVRLAELDIKTVIILVSYIEGSSENQIFVLPSMYVLVVKSCVVHILVQ